jgi:hypothetical protein
LRAIFPFESTYWLIPKYFPRALLRRRLVRPMLIRVTLLQLNGGACSFHGGSS